MTILNLSESPAPRVILGSTSPRRIDLLHRAGLVFTVASPEVQEMSSSSPWLHPEELARGNARLKAEAVSMRHPGALVIGADTVVSLGERIFGKPGSLEEAQDMLFALAGNTHDVFTGVCVRQTELDKSLDVLEEFVIQARVTFHALHPSTIARYLDRVPPLDKAGGYALQEEQGELVARVEGDRDAVIGLPTRALHAVLTRLYPQIWPHFYPTS